MEKAYICIDYLNRQVDSLVRWANKYDKKVLTLAQIKAYIRKSTCNTEEEISLLLKHAEHSGKMTVEKLHEKDPSDESVMCKFSASTRENQKTESAVITQKEKAEFFLKLQVSRIETKITNIEAKIRECDTRIKSVMASGQKERALIHLKKRKLFEGEQAKLHGMQIRLEEQLFAIESASDANLTLETLTMASGVGK